MAAQFSSDLALEIDRTLRLLVRHVHLARSELAAIRDGTRETIAESHALMARIDIQLAQRP